MATLAHSTGIWPGRCHVPLTSRSYDIPEHTDHAPASLPISAAGGTPELIAVLGRACRVEDGRGGTAPFPVPAHQTGRADFPHPAFRLASPQGPRRRPPALASKASHGQLPVDMFARELVRSTPLHFVSLTEEVPRPVIDMLIDGLVCRRESTVGEVGRPAAQNAVQSGPYLVPGALLPGTSSSPTFSLTRCTLFLDGLAPRYQRPPLGRWRGPSV